MTRTFTKQAIKLEAKRNGLTIKQVRLYKKLQKKHRGVYLDIAPKKSPSTES